MSVGRGDLYIYQGDDFVQSVRVVDAQGKDANISAYTAEAQIRRGYADDVSDVAVALTATVESPLVVLQLARADTQKLSGRYRWDLHLIDANGNITTVIAGDVLATQEVTR